MVSIKYTSKSRLKWKLNSKYKRIDGTVALIIAYVVLNRYKIDYENMI